MPSAAQPKMLYLAEAYGILLYCTAFSRYELRIITESGDLAARCPSSSNGLSPWNSTQYASSSGPEKAPL
jgi:hypothetical protein